MTLNCSHHLGLQVSTFSEDQNTSCALFVLETRCPCSVSDFFWTKNRSVSRYKLVDNFTGEDFSAEDALQIGFVSRISKSESQLFEEANQIISKIIANSPVAVSVTKSSLNYSRDHTVREGLDHVALTNSAALMSDDLVKSFMMTSGAGEAAEFAPLQPHSRL